MSKFPECTLDEQLEWIEANQEEGAIPKTTLNKGEVWVAGPSRNKRAVPKDFDQAQRDFWGVNYVYNERFIPGELIIHTLKQVMKIKSQAKTAGFTPYSTARAFVLDYMEKNGITLNEHFTPVLVDKHGSEDEIDLNMMTTKMEEAVDNYNRSIPAKEDEDDHPPQPLAVGMIGKALRAYIHEEFSAHRTETRTDIVYDPSKAHLLKPLVEKLLACYWIYGDLNVQMFMHLLYSIKRRAFKKEVEWDIFFSFFSREGGIGKTELVRAICPDPSGYTELTFKTMQSEHDFWAKTGDSTVANFDELILEDREDGSDGMMAGALSLLKNLITSKDLSVRGFNTQQRIHRKKGFVLCSTSQFPIYDAICDNTGMRKFFSFESTAPVSTPDTPGGKSECRWKEALPILEDIVGIYQMIDENDQIGFFHPEAPYFKEISEVQASYMRKDQMNAFLTDSSLRFCDKREDGATPMDFTTFMNKFRKWRQKRGDKTLGSKTIEMLVKTNCGQDLEHSKRDNKWFYYVKPVVLEEGEDVSSN